MKEVYQSLIATVCAVGVGFLMILIGHLRGTYYSVVIFTYISAVFFILGFIFFLTLLYNIFHKEYPVKRPQDQMASNHVERWEKF